MSDAPRTSHPADEVARLDVVHREKVFDGLVWDVRRDTVRLADGHQVTRDVQDHPGAVGILALNEDDEVLLVKQYRHPAGRYLWEPPAGLLDVDGEHPWRAAQRELWEEAGMVADEWHVLVDYYNSPGGSTEAFRCFLARGVREADGERHEGHGEERDMPVEWVPLEDAVAAVLAGRLHNPTAVSGVLAAHAGRAAGWSSLRPADAPWPERFPDGLPPLTAGADGPWAG
ncbi:MAG: NUDIX domain-containing protein [Motilibacteraceae bacterium]